MLHYNPRHVSSINMPIFRRTNCIITASGIVTLCKWLYSTPVESGLQSAQPFTESDDTRCCDNTICPPEDAHVNARNMSRIVMQHIYCYRIKELCINLVIETSCYLCCSAKRYWSLLWFVTLCIFSIPRKKKTHNDQVNVVHGHSIQPWCFYENRL